MRVAYVYPRSLVCVCVCARAVDDEWMDAFAVATLLASLLMTFIFSNRPIIDKVIERMVLLLAMRIRGCCYIICSTLIVQSFQVLVKFIRKTKQHVVRKCWDDDQKYSDVVSRRRSESKSSIIVSYLE
jgi:hypothetical protein